LFPGYKNLNEFERKQVQKLRKKLAHFNDFEFKVYVVLYSCIEQVTGVDTNPLNFLHDLRKICQNDEKEFLKVYYSTCQNCLVPLGESDLTGTKAFEELKTIGDMFYYITSRNHL